MDIIRSDTHDSWCGPLEDAPVMHLATNIDFGFVSKDDNPAVGLDLQLVSVNHAGRDAQFRTRLHGDDVVTLSRLKGGDLIRVDQHVPVAGSWECDIERDLELLQGLTLCDRPRDLGTLLLFDCARSQNVSFYLGTS